MATEVFPGGVFRIPMIVHGSEEYGGALELTRFGRGTSAKWAIFWIEEAEAIVREWVAPMGFGRWRCRNRVSDPGEGDWRRSSRGFPTRTRAALAASYRAGVRGTKIECKMLGAPFAYPTRMSDPRNLRRLLTNFAEKLERLEAIAAYSDAEQRVNFALFKVLAGRLGLKSLEGMTFDEYFAHVREKKLEEVLLQLEEVNPGLAAKIQQSLDD
jgi:hypothetical protein